jgi:energy-coupling factor transport system ATP-binding protein
LASTATDAKHVLEDAAPVASWQQVSVRYPHCLKMAVGPVSLTIRRGERVLLLGPSGSGKSTLLHTLTGLVPQSILADVAGSIRLFGMAASGRRPAQWASQVAQLFQNPEQMLCGMTVADEVAFALENQGLAPLEIHRRVGSALARVGFPEDQCSRRTATLSGGEKQIVALAAVIAQDAPVLLIDEPTAHLAPAAASRLRSLLMAGRQTTRSVLIVDHRLDGMLGMIDRVIAIDRNGSLIDGGEPHGFLRRCRTKLVANGIRVPLSLDLDAALAAAGVVLAKPPLTMGEAVAELSSLGSKQREIALDTARSFAARHIAAAPDPEPGFEPVAALSDVDCAPLFGPVTLRNLSCALHRGETVAVLGRNGAGKTTLGATLAGLLRPRQGRRSGPLGSMAFQNPENQLLTGSVVEEVRAASESAQRADRLLAEWGLAELADRHPYTLSEGQKRRLALAIALASRNPALLVLDEPTAGLDADGKSVLEQRIESLAGQGSAIAIITHDLDFAVRTCRRALILGQGRVLAEGPLPALMRDRALLERAELEEPAVVSLLRWLEQC